MLKRETVKRIVSAADAGLPAGQYLRDRLGFTKAQIRSMKFRENGITVNGAKSRISRILQEGDAVCVRLEDRERKKLSLPEGDAACMRPEDEEEEKLSLPGCETEREKTSPDTVSPAADPKTRSEIWGRVLPVKGPLEILYEDEDVIAVWKEAGRVSHPAHGHYADTLANLVCGYFQEKGIRTSVRSIGRLDRDTSGIMVFAKHPVAAQRLWAQKEQGVFQKEYLACCLGTFPGEAMEQEQVIREPIGKKRGELMKMEITKEGRQAVTRYQVLAQRSGCALVRLRLETGRTHQIRVHMAWLGHPLAGDVLYGKTEDGMREGLGLCAWKVEFLQPFTGEKILLERRWAIPHFKCVEH